MDIKLYVQTKAGDRTVEASLELGTASQAERVQILAGLFDLFEVKLPNVEEADAMDKAEKAFAEFFKQVDGSSEPEMEDVPKPELELKNGPPWPDAVQNGPEYWRTGIKDQDGIKTYKCRQVCPKCGKKHNRYILPNVSEVSCDNCFTVLRVRPAVEGNLLEPDGWKNFFWADSPIMHFKKY